MKKLMLILVVAMAVPAMAAVNFTAAQDGDNLVISYTTTDGDLPRGIALRVELPEGASADPADAGTMCPAFNTYVDYAYSNPLNFAVGDGHALADPAAAGVLAAAANVFSISAGVLDETGNQAAGPAECTLITLPITCAAGTVTISADTLRGPDSGVVGSVLESNLPITVELSCGPDCDTCQGDFDNSGAVNTGDIVLLVNYYLNNKNIFGQAPASGCFDLDGSGSVNTGDIVKMVNYYLNNKNIFGSIPCPGPGM